MARALQLLCPNRVRVFHVNHQLQTPSAQWAAWLEQQCAAWQLPCSIQAVTVAAGNIEQQARKARYEAIFANVKADEIIVLGHHRQDQAETIFLRLMSGSGAVGLSAMRTLTKRGGYELWRPWLDVSREEITSLAAVICPEYIDDPANLDLQYDRVILRQQIWPMLASRWPAFEQGMTRSAMLMQDCQDILQDVLLADWQQCGDAHRLNISCVHQLSEARQRLLLSRWIQGAEKYAPALQQVEQLRETVLMAREDATPKLDWQDWQFRRYQQYVYRLPLVLPVAVDLSLQIQPNQPFELASGQWILQQQAMGFPLEMFDCGWQLRARQGGETLHLQGKIGRRPLKKCMQDAGLAPWQREQIHLLMLNEQIMGVFTPQGFWPIEGVPWVSQGYLPTLSTS